MTTTQPLKKMKCLRTLGIIGGLGPETTADFYLDIVFSCQRQSKSHRPAIIISSVPLPYEIEEDAIFRNLGIERCLPFLLEEAQKLQKAGADFIVMPCNSLHLFIEEIRGSVQIPVLSIVEETVKFLLERGFHKVGIISTSATVENKLYEEALTKKGITFEKPDDFQQAKMGKIILNLVNGQQKNKDREEIIEVIENFDSNEVECVILACTDLQLLIPKHDNLKVFDTMKIFADATVANMLSIAKK
jgi:aspartate racemase